MFEHFQKLDNSSSTNATDPLSALSDEIREIASQTFLSLLPKTDSLTVSTNDSSSAVVGGVGVSIEALEDAEVLQAHDDHSSDDPHWFDDWELRSTESQHFNTRKMGINGEISGDVDFASQAGQLSQLIVEKGDAVQWNPPEEVEFRLSFENDWYKDAELHVTIGTRIVNLSHTSGDAELHSRLSPLMESLASHLDKNLPSDVRILLKGSRWSPSMASQSSGNHREVDHR